MTNTHVITHEHDRFSYDVKPLAEKLKKTGGNITYEKVAGNQSFIGQRMKPTQLVGKWIQTIADKESI